MAPLKATLSVVSPEYSKMLRAALKDAGIEEKTLATRPAKGGARHGTSKQVVWRVLHHKEEPTFDAAERVRQRIQHLAPDLTLPPPAVAVTSPEHFEYLMLGTRFMREDIEGFRELLSRVKKIAAEMKRERQAREALRNTNETDP